MKECEICWSDKEEFFNLECCPHDICQECIEQIRAPSCPFCRSFISILSIGRRNSISYDPPENLHENYFLWSSMDDLYLYSRWYRRQRRRVERLRQREDHDRSNGERNRRHNLRRQVQQDLREYLENRNRLQTNENSSDNSSSESNETSSTENTVDNNHYDSPEVASVSLQESDFPHLTAENSENKKKKSNKK